MGINQCRLDEITKLITDGKHGDCADDPESGYYFISSKDVKKNKINYTNARQITFEDFQETNLRTRFEPEDILVTNSGTIGRMAFAEDKPETKKTTFQKSVAIIKPDSEKVFPKWLYYHLQFDMDRIADLAGGAAQKNLLLKDLRSIKVPLISIHTQLKIATILSAYDDLIENNLKRIKLLEEMAQITYEEWFVRLKFPGHETTPMASETGLPVGWSETEITEISFINANSIKTKEAPETIKYIDIASADTGFYDVPQIMSFAEAPSRARRKVNFGDTIFSTVRPNRKTYSLILEDDAMLVASTGFAVLTPKIEDTFPFVYLTVANQSFVDKAVTVAGGAAYPAINQNDFEKIKIIKPDNALIRLFSGTVINNFLVKRMLTKQNQLLKEARDILLPRLMTGMIDVEQLPVAQLDIQYL